MSVKIQLGLSGSIIGLLIFGIIVGGIFIQETKNTANDAKQTAAKNVKIAQEFDKRVSTFIDNWEKRVKVTNEVNNITQRSLLGLSTNASQILQQQLTNEKHILGNLTAHRHVANTTRDITFQILNQSLEQERQLLDLQNKTDTLTGSQYAKLADMRVKSIIGNISAEHEQIEQQHDDILTILKNNTR
jgi:uncharacterized membrane-anchored protein YhcB (DUF1043 family)